jgi:hypothetical protein
MHANKVWCKLFLYGAGHTQPKSARTYEWRLSGSALGPVNVGYDGVLDRGRRAGAWQLRAPSKPSDRDFAVLGSGHSNYDWAWHKPAIRDAFDKRQLRPSAVIPRERWCCDHACWTVGLGDFQAEDRGRF